jgi:hypothetical protein
MSGATVLVEEHADLSLVCFFQFKVTVNLSLRNLVTCVSSMNYQKLL